MSINLSLIKNFKNFNNLNLKSFVAFKVNKIHIGYVHKNLASKIYSTFKNNFISTNEELILSSLNNKEINFNNLTNFFKEITKWLLKEQYIPQITNEYFNVSSLNKEEVLFKIERTAVNIFGIRAKGIHLNGYVLKNNAIYLWIAKRSKNKWFYPSKLDNLVAGAISVGYSAFNTLIKEALEEANISSSLVNKAQLSNELHYLYLYKNTIRNDVMYVYNLEIPLAFIPTPNDNEVESFTLMKTSEVVNRLTTTNDFKFNSAIATIFFLLEKKIINKNNTHINTFNGILKRINKMVKKPINF